MALSSSPTLRDPDFPLPSTTFGSSPPDLPAEIGVATTVKMPIRAKPVTAARAFPGFSGYEHGAPLSDIGEEETVASLTPRSKATRLSRSPSPTHPLSPSPDSVIEGPETPRERRSSIGTASDGSDEVDWENFDSSKMMSGRLAADVAREQEYDGFDSKRNSMISTTDGDEMAVLNDKAEQILADARKRLTHMEDNLSKARHSVLWSPRSSPNMSDHHQPVGSLYRSISLAGAGKRYSRPLIKPGAQTHARGSSDTTPTSGLKRLSMVPERSSSAQEYSRIGDSPQYHTTSSPIARLQAHSPSSNQSANSPLRALEEEDEESKSPSTSKTSPESRGPRGLGIDTMDSQHKQHPRSTSSPVLKRDASAASLGRSESAASTRSIRESMSDLRHRINDLKAQTQADKDRRRVQTRDTPSPFNSANPEQWYTTSPEYKQPGSPNNANAGQGWSSHDRSKRLDAQVTPQAAKSADFLQVETPRQTATPGGRTDMNTPSLAQPSATIKPAAHDSVMEESQYEDAAQDFEDDQVAASEEEQVYLNEVLEESLQDVEPNVPDVPEHLLPEANAERHEDRLDAFDYENMFLHSAMGNYRGRESESDTDGTESVETSRAYQTTPTAERSNGTAASEMASNDDNADADHDAEDVEDVEEDDEEEDDTKTETAEELPTPTTLAPPSRPWLRSSRSNSVESVSTEASFATATEGGGTSHHNFTDAHSDEEEEDETPHEILGWGQTAPTAFPAPPQTSPRREIPPPAQFPSPHSSARTTSPPLRLKSNGLQSLDTQQQSQPTRTTPAHSPATSLSTSSVRSHRSIPRPTPPKSTTTAIHSPHATNSSRSTTTSNNPHPANTEILMESLIKLADPDFRVEVSSPKSITDGRIGVFADIDKDLVLALLREVGSVCNGVLVGERRGGGSGAEEVRELRARLEGARGVLEGRGVREREDL